MIDHDKDLVERLARLLFWQRGGDRWPAAKDIDKDGYRRNAMGLLDEIETAGFQMLPMSEELREKIARIACEGAGDDFEAFGKYWIETHYAETADKILALIDHLESDGGVEAMRERCAVLVENWNGSTRDGDTLHIAMAIRELSLSAAAGEGYDGK